MPDSSRSKRNLQRGQQQNRRREVRSQAVVEIREARQALDKALKNPKSEDLEMNRASTNLELTRQGARKAARQEQPRPRRRK